MEPTVSLVYTTFLLACIHFFIPSINPIKLFTKKRVAENILRYPLFYDLFIASEFVSA